MELEFIHRTNIERFEQLLASGTLATKQIAVVTSLLESEIEALARLAKPCPPDSNPPAAP